MMQKQIKIADLVADDKNYNKGSERGNALIEKSLRKLGAGRSILIDKNNRIIAGNKTIETAGAIGLEDIVVVETTGDKIVAVKRMDIDLDSEQGREMALADNATAKASIEWDADTLTQDWNKEKLDEWSVDLPKFQIEEDDEPAAVDQSQWFLNIRCDSEDQCQELYEKFIQEGLDVKIVT